MICGYFTRPQKSRLYGKNINVKGVKDAILVFSSIAYAIQVSKKDQKYLCKTGTWQLKYLRDT